MSSEAPFFSIITVSYNSGSELYKTIESVLSQSFTDFEVIVKDGGSTDDSLDTLKDYVSLAGAKEKVKIYETSDNGIYDAMNEAVGYAKGEYYLFLNCGDYLADTDVLEKTCLFIKSKPGIGIYYGDRFNRLNKSVEYISPVITESVCYRNIPCHQSCFYGYKCFEKEAYRTQYIVRADYEHFLRCVLAEKMTTCHLGFPVSSYQGGGFSETEKGRKISAIEHKEITKLYIPAKKRFLYKARLIITLAPLRNKIASNPKLSEGYNRLVKKIYR